MCVDLQLQTCSDVTYNRTAFPTLLQHRSREAVESSSEYILLSVLHHLLEGQEEGPGELRAQRSQAGQVGG